jgi:hypothetical protein
MNSLQQQARFDAFVSEFNDERPHEALGMQTPSERYPPSPRPYLGLPDLAYPLHDRDALVTAPRAHLHAPQEGQHLVRAGRPSASASRKSTTASGS